MRFERGHPSTSRTSQVSTFMDGRRPARACVTILFSSPATRLAHFANNYYVSFGWKVSFLPKAADKARNHHDRFANVVSLCQQWKPRSLIGALARLDANRILRLAMRESSPFRATGRREKKGGSERSRVSRVYISGGAAQRDSFLISMKIAFGDFDDNAIPVF